MSGLCADYLPGARLTAYMLLTLKLTTDLIIAKLYVTSVRPCRIACQCKYKRTRQTTPYNRLYSATQNRVADDLCLQLEQLFQKVNTHIGAPP